MYVKKNKLILVVNLLLTIAVSSAATSVWPRDPQNTPASQARHKPQAAPGSGKSRVILRKFAQRVSAALPAATAEKGFGESWCKTRRAARRCMN